MGSLSRQEYGKLTYAGTGNPPEPEGRMDTVPVVFMASALSW